jgi:YesN/AraC family two-component response regulator
MPNGDGFEVIEAIKTARRGTKIIAISGGGTYLPAAEYLKLARSIGADEIVLKPFTHRQIFDAVNRVLS